MAKAYSMDLRERILVACESGQGAAEVAQRYAVSESFIEKLKRRYRESGSLAPKPHAGGRQPLLAAYEAAIRAQFQEQPDTTLAELREILGVKVQLSTLWYYLQRLGLTFKKNRPSRRTGARRRARPTGRLAGGITAPGFRPPGLRR